VLEELGDDHAAAFHGDEAVESYLESLILVRPDPAATSARVRLCRKAARMAAQKAGTFRVRPDPSLPEELIQEGLSAAEDDESRAWLLALSGECGLYWMMMKGDDPVPMQQRIDSVREALALAEGLDQPDLQIFAIGSLSELYEVAGSYELSVQTARRQLPLLDRVESASERALSLFGVGIGLADLAGEYDEAIELARRSYELAKGLSSHERMHGLYGQISPLYHLGRWEEVLSLLEEHLEHFRLEADVSCFGVQGGVMFGALTLARMGNVERSMELGALVPRTFDEALRGEGLRALLASAVGDHEGARTLAADLLAKPEAPWRAPESGLAMVEALTALGRWEELAEHMAHVRNFAGALITLGPACDRAEALARAAAGDLEGAADSLGRTLEAFDRLGERYEAARTREVLAGVTSIEKGRDLLAEALRQYEDLGARPDADRVRPLLSDA
jgi:tetratricopeptide (TPR) repeat protein